MEPNGGEQHTTLVIEILPHFYEMTVLVGMQSVPDRIFEFLYVQYSRLDFCSNLMKGQT